jgi:hypothetical protein
MPRLINEREKDEHALSFRRARSACGAVGSSNLASERLDTLCAAHEGDHDRDADQEEHDLDDVSGGVAEPNRIASAQPPAKAAPNTSAPIRIAALMTVMTLGHAISRALASSFLAFMTL